MNKTCTKLKKAYFVSHNGLGDNITNISAVNFLLQYYETVFFLCKDIHAKNVEYLFPSELVIVVPFDANHEFTRIKEILNNVSDDIFASGMHKKYIKNRITQPELLSYKQNDKNYTVGFPHIREFYYDIGLDISIYYDYFDIKSTNLSKKYYDELKKYKIIFMHSKASNREINLTNIYETYKNNAEYIMICCNKNIYDKEHPLHEVADKYVNLYVAHYIDIIKAADLFYIIDSCFSCIIYPLMMKGVISKNKVNLYIRK
jgi:hypothetical protein